MAIMFRCYGCFQGIMLEYDNNVIHKLRVLIDMKEVKDRV